MARRIGGGVASFQIDGVALQTKAEADVEAPLFNVEKTSLQPGFYTEKQVAPKLKGTFLFTDNFPVETLAKADNMVIQVVFDSQRSVVLTGAHVEGMPSVKSSGEIEIEFAGEQITWSL